MDISAKTSSSNSPIVTVEGQTAIPVPDGDRRSQRIAGYLQNLNRKNFIRYMNEIGWLQDGEFVALLSTVGHYFDEKDGRIVTRKWFAPVACALSVLIFELLPFNLPTMKPLPRLPIEIWEYVIDCVERVEIDRRYVRTAETPILHACTLVCRSWHARASLNLYRKFEIWGDRLSNLKKTLRNNSSMLSSPNTIRVLCRTSSISALFLESKFKNLRCLALNDLDLAKEHVLIMRGPLSHSVTKLDLVDLHSCTLSSLHRFLKSFRCLIDLDLGFDVDFYLAHSGKVLPPPHPMPNSLTNFQLGVIPGVDELIEWYIREGSFLARLKKLNLTWDILPEGDIPFGVVESLLRHCMGSLEDLTLTGLSSVNKGPLMEKIVDNIVLYSLPNLRRITWWCGYSSVVQIAATQLCSIREPCKIEEIIFGANSSTEGKEYEKLRDYCKIIDEALTSDNFPSLRSVQLYKSIPFDLFPTLQSRKLLYVCRW